jgi:hypothetical protein
VDDKQNYQIDAKHSKCNTRSDGRGAGLVRSASSDDVGVTGAGGLLGMGAGAGACFFLCPFFFLCFPFEGLGAGGRVVSGAGATTGVTAGGLAGGAAGTDAGGGSGGGSAGATAGGGVTGATAGGGVTGATAGGGVAGGGDTGGGTAGGGTVGGGTTGGCG